MFSYVNEVFMLWDSIMTADPKEYNVSLGFEGQIPTALLQGDYYLIGPGKIAEYGRRVHPFDGHGLLRKFTFYNDKIAFRSRFVETEAYTTETRKGKVCHRGIGGLPYRSSFQNFLLRARKNPANTTVTPWQDKLLCGYEGGWPHIVAPDDLSTLGLEDFSNTLKPGMGFLAHTRFDVQTNELFGVSFKPGKNSTFHIHGYGPDGKSILQTAYTLKGMTLIHDFLLTDRYVIIIENPMAPDYPVLLKALIGVEPLILALHQQERPARILLFPRTGGQPTIIEMDKTYMAFHHACAFESLNSDNELTHLTLYSCLFDKYIDFGSEFGYQGYNKPFSNEFSQSQSAQKLTKITIELPSKRCTTEVVSDWGLDFPKVHPLGDGRGSTHIYGATTAPKGSFNPFDTFCRINLQTGAAETWTSDCGILGEGYFVPTGKTEQEGYVIVAAYREDGTDLLILNGDDLPAGPVAKIPLPEVFPYGFHGHFSPYQGMR